jgi:hypothetical protein
VLGDACRKIQAIQVGAVPAAADATLVVAVTKRSGPLFFSQK